MAHSASDEAAVTAEHETTGATPAGAPARARQRADAASRLHGLSAIGARYLQHAARELDQGRLDDAARALQAVAALAPQHPEVLRLQAVVAWRRGQPAQALPPLQRALAQWPDDAHILGNLGGVLSALGDADNAVRVFARAAEVAPAHAGNWFNLGLALESLARHDEAGAALRRALELAPDHLGARLACAANLAALGDIEGAAAAWRAAIAVAPGSAQAWLGLVDLKTTRLSDDEMAALEALYTSTALDEDARATAGFAFGKALEDRARFDEALAVLHAANAARRKHARWDARAFLRGVDAIIDAFGRGEPAAPSEPDDGGDVVFVVGMPRSGTTLVEQILGAHPGIEGASELPDLDAVIREESQRRGQPFVAWVPLATPEDWQRLGRRYLERTRRWRAHRPRHVDKMPDNWLVAGAALAMLPGARVVDCRRDALETAWSCYKQRFANGRHPYAYDFADIAAQLRDHDRLMRHWEARFEGRVRLQSYEALVSDPESEVRALLAFCALPFDPACLDFHKAQRAVRSASAAQVRRPIERDTARAKDYGDRLAALQRLLRPDESAAGAPVPIVRVPAPAAPARERLAMLPAQLRRALEQAESMVHEASADASAAAIDAVSRACPPGHIEPLRLRAMWEAAQGRFAPATTLLAAAIERERDDALLHNTLGVVRAAAGELEAARASFARAFELDPRSAACANLAQMQLDARDNQGARHTYEAALAHAPDLLPARRGLASLLRDEGDAAGAASHLRTCLAQDPVDAQAWAALAELCGGALSAQDLDFLFAALRRPGLAEDSQVLLTRACGRVLEARARPREAFAMIAAANAAAVRDSRWDATRHARSCAEIEQAFAHPPAADDARRGEGVVFIVDVARLGAGFERDLAAHPDVARGGERPLLAELVAEESRMRGMPFPQWVAHATPADWRRLGERYLERARAQSGAQRWTDRSPTLPRLLGAAAAMLPGARVIELRCDPLQGCWALYRHGGSPFASDIACLAGYWRDCTRLLGLWREQLGSRLLAFDDTLDGAARVAALRDAATHAGLSSADACVAAAAARHGMEAAIDMREAGLRQTPAAGDLGALLEPLRMLLASARVEAKAAGDVAASAPA
ncbi:MAG: tetratricopeptide repeat protein [Lysobacteraceae bacterium]|nr:MAG: tetratricopeptide repeat protein [Xanthomonadaceae bacterium]